MAFKTYIDSIFSPKKVKPVFSNPGSSIINTYEFQIVDGVETLVPVGKRNIQDYIDSFADSCDIHNVITRFLNGDSSVLNSAVGRFGDFTDVPTSYAEMFERAKQCEELFKSLPVEIRQKFDNSHVKFWDSFGSDYFDTVFNDYNSSLNVQTSPVEEVIEPVSDVIVKE